MIILFIIYIILKKNEQANMNSFIFYFLFFDLIDCQFRCHEDKKIYNVSPNYHFKNENYFLIEETAQK